MIPFLLLDLNMTGRLLGILCCFLLMSCSEKKQIETALPVIEVKTIPKINTPHSALSYNKLESLWTLNGEMYSGYAVKYYTESLQKEKFGIVNGKKQNESISWYPDGHQQSIASYHNGKLHGTKKVWSADSAHVLIAELNYHLGKAHGEQKKWYPTGERFKVLNLNMGKEEGLQQAYRKNGDLFANYEAREGRIFGLKRAALCFDLKDEKVQLDE